MKTVRIQFLNSDGSEWRPEYSVRCDSVLDKYEAYWAINEARRALSLIQDEYARPGATWDENEGG